MKPRLVAALVIVSAALTLAATPATSTTTETGRTSFAFCIADGGRTVDECEAYAAEAEEYAIYVGSEVAR